MTRSATASAFTILIVDDVPANIGVVARQLEALRIRVLVAQDGEEALERARFSLPDLILLDIRMPGPDGFETCRRLKADTRTSDIPVIFMTALSGMEDIVEGFAVGGVDYVVKPFQLPEVMARINTHLTLQGMHRQHIAQNARLQQEIRVRTAAEAELRRSRDELELRVADRTQELERINAVLTASREQLRKLTDHLEVVREEERKHIAMEVHDELGQLLTALKMDVSLLEMRLTNNPQVEQKLGEMRDLVERTIGMVRHVTNNLRPAALNYGIVPALEWLTEDFSRRNAAACRLNLHGQEPVLDDRQATAIFRIAQESLTNVARHAGASVVTVTLSSNAGAVVLEISDNGQGFDPDQARPGHSYGLLGMIERARALGAEMQVRSSPGAGATISISILLLNELEA